MKTNNEGQTHIQYAIECFKRRNLESKQSRKYDLGYTEWNCDNLTLTDKIAATKTTSHGDYEISLNVPLDMYIRFKNKTVRGIVSRASSYSFYSKYPDNQETFEAPAPYIRNYSLEINSLTTGTPVCKAEFYGPAGFPTNFDMSYSFPGFKAAGIPLTSKRATNAYISGIEDNSMIIKVDFFHKHIDSRGIVSVGRHRNIADEFGRVDHFFDIFGAIR